jgi:DNA ligase D-like protein (predicted 3'-phosphoesterase)
MTDDKLKKYRAKRDFDRTAEPAGEPPAESDTGRPIFVIQKHDASRLHYDFRIEMSGVLKSWAVPKGPSLNPADKRLAVEVEDHPLDYADFEGTIPEAEYGGGTVMVWDFGTYTNIKRAKGDSMVTMQEAYEMGTIEIELSGKKLHGGYALRRFKREGDKDQWLLIKMKDAHADPARDITKTDPDSAKTGRTLKEIAAGA